MYQINLSHYPELKKGDRWVTLKPHGPDSTDYVRVIIREHSDGSAHIVWAGRKGFEHLRINRPKNVQHVADGKGVTRKLTPEEEQKIEELRQKYMEQVELHHEKMGVAIASRIGANVEHGRVFADALKTGDFEVSLPTNPQKAMLQKQRQETRAKDILEGNIDDEVPGVDPGQVISPDSALAMSSISHLTGDAPNPTQIPKEASDAWNIARTNPNVMQDVAGIRAKHREELSKLKREFRKNAKLGLTTMRVDDTMAWYEDPGENERALQRQALERARYEMNSRFWEKHSELGQGAAEWFNQGCTDALVAISSEFSMGKAVHPGTMEIFGVDVMSAALAAEIARSGDMIKEYALKNIEPELIKNAAPAVSDALEIADEADERREKIKDGLIFNNLSDIAKVDLMKQESIRKYKALARVAGSVETGASILKHLKAGVKDIVVEPGVKINEVISSLDKYKVGYEMVHNEGKTALKLKGDDLHKLMYLANDDVQKRQTVDEIKASKGESAFKVPGLKKDIRLAPEQQRPILMLEAVKKVFAKMSVGLGKTITAGSAFARLNSQGAVEQAWYIVPTSNLGSTYDELRDNFPDLDIQVAHGAFNGRLKSPDDRRNLYGNSEAHLILIGQDTVREDADELSRLCNSGQGPQLIIGDEIHAMFTPEGEPSGRNKALLGLRADYMMALTGTPIRRHSNEVRRVIEWLDGNSQDDSVLWDAKWGKIGQGVSAYSDAVDKNFRKTIGNYVISENYTPDVPIEDTIHTVDLDDVQHEKIAAINKEHNEKAKAPFADRQKIAQEKANKIREVVYNGDHKNNSVLRAVREMAVAHINDGERGIIHCNSLSAVKDVAAMFKPGEAITYVGVDNVKRRGEILSAINDGALITGGRVSTDDGREGVLLSRGVKNGLVQFSDGKDEEVSLEMLKSKVMVVVGTSRAVGVLSTGLNVQKSATWSFNYQLPDSAATLNQRRGRIYRRGQDNKVTIRTFVPNLPNYLKKLEEITDQKAALNTMSDPTDFDENDDLVAK